jgi:hypothetical protein
MFSWFVLVVVLWSVWICQRSHEHCHCSSHPPLSTRLPCSSQPYEQPPPSVGRQGRSQLAPPLDFMTTLIQFSHCLFISASYRESRIHLLVPIYVLGLRPWQLSINNCFTIFAILYPVPISTSPYVKYYKPQYGLVPVLLLLHTCDNTWQTPYE